MSSCSKHTVLPVEQGAGLGQRIREGDHFLQQFLLILDLALTIEVVRLRQRENIERSRYTLETFEEISEFRCLIRKLGPQDDEVRTRRLDCGLPEVHRSR